MALKPTHGDLLTVATGGIQVDGLRELRRDLRAAQAGTTRELSKGIRRVGEPLAREAGDRSPRVSGELAAGYGVRVRGTTGEITTRVPYGAGAEWGQRGKWKGFARYGRPGSRFAGAVIDERADETMELLAVELGDVITIRGWAV